MVEFALDLANLALVLVHQLLLLLPDQLEKQSVARVRGATLILYAKIVGLELVLRRRFQLLLARDQLEDPLAARPLILRLALPAGPALEPTIQVRLGPASALALKDVRDVQNRGHFLTAVRSCRVYGRDRRFH